MFLTSFFKQSVPPHVTTLPALLSIYFLSAIKQHMPGRLLILLSLFSTVYYVCVSSLRAAHCFWRSLLLWSS